MHGLRAPLDLAGLSRAGWVDARGWRLAAASLVIAALLAGAVAGGRGMPSQTEPALANLLRFMAIIKAAMVVGTAALVDWRLRKAGPVLLRVALVMSAALMATAPGLIWGLSHVLAGAVLFHIGLLSFLLIAYADLKT